MSRPSDPPSARRRPTLTKPPDTPVIPENAAVSLPSVPNGPAMPVQLSLTRTMSVPTAAPLSILPTRHRDIPLVPPDSLVVSEKRLEVEDGVARVDSSQITGLSQRKKWSLLAIFSLAIFVDIWSYSSFFILTQPIADDLGVVFEQQSWVITSYAVTFSSFLLFWGRCADLWGAQPIFSGLFVVLGILNLIISFLPDKFSFFILRAVSGVAGAGLIPASYRLITAVFIDKDELSRALTIYGMSGALANITGTIIAGLLDGAGGTGQMAPWRWYFRMLAGMIIPIAIAAIFYVPRPQAVDANVEKKWKRLDLVGCGLMLAGIVMITLALTFGAAYGWATASFIAPLIIAIVAFPAFFYWESKLAPEAALLPSRTWRIPNFTVFVVFALFLYGWFACNFLIWIEVFENVHGDSPIVAALRVVPQGVTGFATSLFLTWFPKYVARPRWPAIGGMLVGMVATILFLLYGLIPDPNVAYLATLFPAFSIAASGLTVVFQCINVGVMTAVPPDMAGVAGAVLQVAFQVGSAIALSIQAGLLTSHPGSIYNFANIQTSFGFELGWLVLWLVGFALLYRQPKIETGERVILAH